MFYICCDRMKILVVLLSLNISYGYSQVDTLFFDKNWKACKKENAAFYRTNLEKGNLFEVNDFYMNNVLQMKGQSSYKDSLFRQGDFYYYNVSGNLIETVTYIDNLRHGKSIQYFDNGKIKRITNFTNGDFNGETIYYNSKGILIGKGLSKDNYWYGKWEKYNDDGSFLTYLFYDDKFTFDEIGVKVSTPNTIWLFFDKVENETTIKYLCRPTNHKYEALAKFSEAPDVHIIVPKKPVRETNLEEPRLDYTFKIYDTSINIDNVEIVKHVPVNDKLDRKSVV